MFFKGYLPAGEKRSAMMLKVGDAELLLYGDTLIGLRSPEGTWRLEPYGLGYTHRDMATLKRKQVFFNLRAGWIGQLSAADLEEKAGRIWLKAYAMYARDRMQGGEA